MRACPQIIRFSSTDQARRVRCFATRDLDGAHYPKVDTISRPRCPAEQSDRTLTLELWADGAFRNPYTTLREAYERQVGTGEPIREGDKILSVTLDR